MVALKKILFPTDFSENAGHAFKHAVRLANFNSGEVIIQHVVADYFDRNPHWATLFDIHQLQKFMDGYLLTEMAGILPSDEGAVHVRPVISKGKSAEEISALAEREHVDMVVMGSAKGVITNKVIRLTNRPVLAVSSKLPSPGASKLQKIERILVATDFSEHSKKVVEYAFELKRLFNASLWMLYVIETSKAIEFAIRQGNFTGNLEKLREWASNQLINLTPDEFVSDPGVKRLVESGPAGDRIADVAFEIQADLTILGTHEYGAVHKHLLGTTTDSVLTRIASPVLTLKL
jgi:nucleotide-binding universal stress UspA family protein